MICTTSASSSICLVRFSRSISVRWASNSTSGAQAHQAAEASPPLVRIPHANVYRFGQGNAARPVFEGLEWTIHDDGREAWAVVGAGSGRKTALLEVRIHRTSGFVCSVV
jgi:ABC-type molybdenum transport system ATPase subunit/photorepair protein PhrA